MTGIPGCVPRSLSVFVLGASILGGCAKPPPPVLSLEGRQCVSQPDLKVAMPVPLAENNPVKVTLDEKTSCIENNGSGKVEYVAFDLPQVPQPYLLSVTSMPIGEGVLTPRLTLLDPQGNTLREIPSDLFMSHGTSLRAGLRPRSGERYLIVSSDPGMIGQTTSRIVEGTQVSQTGGPIIIQIHTGSENNVSTTSAYNGIVTVAAMPMPKAP